MRILEDIAKELRSDIKNIPIDSQYNIGKKDGIKKILMLIESIQMTKKCPYCGTNIYVEYSEKANELIMRCESFDCGYEQALNQVGY